EGMVGAVLAGPARPLASAASGREGTGVAAGVQVVRECVRAVAMPDPPNGRQSGVPLVELEPASVDLLPAVGRGTVLSGQKMKSGYVGPDPPRPEQRSRRREKKK